MSASTTKHFRTCPLCEATCGLEIEIEGDQVVKVRGDVDDPFSKGFICPKGASIGELHSDPDCLTSPMLKGEDGVHRPVGWDKAFAAIESGLGPILADGDRNAVGVYVGNPNAHTLDGLIHLRALLKGIGSKSVFSASSVDQMPKQISVGLMFGAGLTVPIPDIDRSDYMLILGANPMASNGSLMTVPDFRGRMRTLQARGGKVVVIDPRFSRTAKEADRHHFIRPATDAHLLAAIAQTLIAEGLTATGRLEDHTAGLDEIAELLAPFDPEAVAAVCGIDAEDIRTIARELAAAKAAAVYGRIGTTTQSFGTLASWLVDVINILTGNLDREGGVMFPLAAAGATNASGEPGRGRGLKLGRWSSRVRGLGESFGELPVACLSEEIETDGPGQIRAMITVAGNPLVSTPDSGRLTAAFESLEFVVSVDRYLNETTRHADVILPVPSPLARAHYDLAFYQLSVRNAANYSPPSLPLPEGMEPEWRTLLRLLGVVTGQGSSADVDAIDDFVALEVARKEIGGAGERMAGVEPEQMLALAGDRTGPARVLDIMLRCGPYGAGDQASPAPNGKPELCLDVLEDQPHGVDLGPLKPRIPEVLRTPSGKIELCPPEITSDLVRLEDSLAVARDEMVLVGRRHLRSNNSWMHNLPKLARGPERCTLQLNPSDAERLGIEDGCFATIKARVGQVELVAEVTDAIMPGVVSIPHGWGHDVTGTQLEVAGERPGVNSNLLADSEAVDPISGNAVLNGIPVSVAAAP